MTYYKIFFNLLFSILCCFFSSTIIPGMPGQNMMGMNTMDFESEVEEMNKIIQDYVSSLPPAEQEEFNRQVEEMTQMFENMSDDDIDKLMNELFADEAMTESNPFEISEPQVEEIKEVVLTSEDKKKIETILKIVNDIINQSNLFNVIVNSSPELPNRITRWGNKGEILNWQETSDWDKFRIELDAFVQMLYKLLDQDITTKKYKYIFDVIEDQGLYNNLIQLQTELNKLVPKVDIPEFNVQKLSDESKETIKEILGKYAEGFYLLNITQAINKIFEKYLPEAEKIRVSEEAATKKALDAQKGTRTPAAKTEAGIESDDMGYDSGYYGGSDYGYSSYDPYSSYGGGYNDYGYSPDYGSYGDYGSDSSSRRSGGDGSSGGGERGSYGSSNGETGDSKDKSKKGKGRGDKSSFVPNVKIERAIADVKSGLGDIIKAMTPDETTTLPTNLANLAETIKKDDIDIILAGATLPMVSTNLSTMNDAIKKITKETFNADDLAHYQREIQNAFTKNNKELKALRDEIDKFEFLKTEEEKEAAKKRESTKIDASTLPEEHQWAYFGQETLATGDKADKLQEQIKARASLFDIKEQIDTLFKDVDQFAKKQAPVMKQEPKPDKEDSFSFEE